MGILNSFLKPIVAAGIVATAYLQPLVANAADIDTLMLQLKDADPADAARIADEIQLEWNKSGSASADFLLKRGREALERGEVSEAIEHLTALVDHAPDFSEGWVMRAGAYFHAGLLGPAVHDLEQALRLNPQHFEAMIGLATLFEMIDRPKDAYEAYRQVKAIHPAHPDVTEALKRLEPQAIGQKL